MVFQDMNEPITIHDMQSFAESLVEPRMSSDIGNVIDLGTDGGSLGDDLGFGLLTNSKVMNTGTKTVSVAAPPPSSSSSSSSFSSSSGPDITVGNLEPLEPISFDLPTSSESAFPEVSVRRDTADNAQTATGPGIQLSAPTKRLTPEEERAQKAELINKLNRLETKGFTISKRFTMDNSLDEIKQEFERLMDARNLESSIKFQRQMMMGVVTGLELMNNKFNPFDWQLEGWSESVHENVDDYDEVFEELYDKYKGKGQMPPEARLLFMMVGSGFMFHMSNSFFRQKMGNMTMDDILKNNPALAKQMAAAAAQAAGPGFGNFMGAAMGAPPMQQPSFQPPSYQSSFPSAAPGGSTGAFFQPPNAPASIPQQPPKRREMAPPKGVDDILQTFQEVRQAEVSSHPIFSPSPQQQQQSPAAAALSEIQSIHSEDIASQGTAATDKTGGRRRKAQLPVGNSISLNL